MSIAFLLKSKEEAVVWRGPKKTGTCKAINKIFINRLHPLTNGKLKNQKKIQLFYSPSRRTLTFWRFSLVFMLEMALVIEGE